MSHPPPMFPPETVRLVYATPPFIAVCPPAPPSRSGATLPDLKPGGPPFPAWLDGLAVSSRSTSKAVEGGRTKDGRQMLVGRGSLDRHGLMLPACVYPDAGTAYAGWNGEEVRLDVLTLEVLYLARGDVQWVRASDGDVPAYAFPVCPMPNGEYAYCARVHYDGAVIPGRIIESEGACHIGYNNMEMIFKQYEVLAIV